VLGLGRGMGASHPSHANLTHFFSSPNLGGGRGGGMGGGNLWGSAHASPVLMGAEDGVAAFAGGAGAAGMAAPYGASLPWNGSREALPRVPSHPSVYFGGGMGVPRMGSTPSLLGALAGGQNGRNSPSLLRNVSYDLLARAQQGGTPRAGGGKSGTERAPGSKKEDDLGKDGDDLEDAGVDALRALKASNPDLMGLAAKMAKRNSLTNLSQLDKSGGDDF